jgi:thiol:disulfide interchange protein
MNPGDSGAAPKIKWAAEDAEVGALAWPVPERIPVSGLTNFGYAEQVVLPFPARSTGHAQFVKVEARLEWLVCKVECVPGFGHLTLRLPVTRSVKSVDSDAIDAYLKRAPLEAGGPSVRTLEIEGDEADIEIKGVGSWKEVHFFPTEAQLITTRAPSVRVNGPDVVLSLTLNPNRPAERKLTSAVVAGVDETGTSRAFTVPLALAIPAASWVTALLFALLGGVILNLMPCVFPVLSIKVLSFLGPEKDLRHLRRAGWAYSAGVVVSFLALGAVLLLLRAAGQSLGWGFQMQSPGFVAFLLALFFAIGLNLLGVFEVGNILTRLRLPRSLETGTSPSAAFATGVLATVVATPCTAPFMGAAIGSTLHQSAGMALGVFGALGVGMALPFLALSYWTGLLEKLPRPGAWMITLRKWLAVPIFMTVAWLAWVLAQQLVPSKEPANRNWAAFDGEKIAALKREKKPYFIDFTASWCITCQVNKRAVLDTDEIQNLFRAKGISLFRADWTSYDPVITQALAERGRNSLPVYVYFNPLANSEQKLPELLTKTLIHDLLK